MRLKVGNIVAIGAVVGQVIGVGDRFQGQVSFKVKWNVPDPDKYAKWFREDQLELVGGEANDILKEML